MRGGQLLLIVNLSTRRQPPMVWLPRLDGAGVGLAWALGSTLLFPACGDAVGESGHPASPVDSSGLAHYRPDLSVRPRIQPPALLFETGFAILCATARYHQFAAWRCVAR